VTAVKVAEISPLGLTRPHAGSLIILTTGASALFCAKLPVLVDLIRNVRVSTLAAQCIDDSGDALRVRVHTVCWKKAPCLRQIRLFAIL